MHIKLLADVNSMVLDGAVMNPKFCADLFAGLAFTDHAQDTSLGSSQVFEPRFVLQKVLRPVTPMKKVSCQRAAHIKLAGSNSPDSFCNLNERTIFQDVALKPEIHRCMENVLFVMDR